MSVDPVELITGLSTSADVSKTEFVAYEKTNIRDFANADEVRNSELDGRWVIFVRDLLSFYRKNTESTEEDDGDNFIEDDSGNVWEAISLTGGVSNDDLVVAFGDTPNTFLTPNEDGEWVARALVGDDLPNPTALTRGGIFALPAGTGVVVGLDEDGDLITVGSTGTGTVVRSESPTLAALALSGSQTTGALIISQTWNTSGVAHLIKATLVDAGHGVGSTLLSLYGGAAGTTLRYSVDTSGNMAAGGNISGASFFGTAQSATALVVGRLGTVTPALQIDSATASGITGVKVTAQATGNGVNLDAIGEVNVPLIINAAGSGTISLGTSSTGDINLYRNTSVLHNSTPTISFGISGNIKGTFASLGSGGFEFKGASNNILMAIVPVAATNQVNYPRLRPNSAGGGVILDAVGTDTDINFSFVAKGAGAILMSTGGGTNQVQVTHTASASRFLTMTGSNGGNPTISTTAGDLAITPNVVLPTVQFTGDASGHIAERAFSVQNSGDTNNSSSGSGAYLVHNLNFVLPANFLSSGKALRILAAFRITTGGTAPTLDVQLRAGSTVLAHVGATTPPASLANNQYGLQFILQATTAVGAAANCECVMFGNSNAPGQVAVHSDTDMPVALATNGTLTLQMATQWATAGVGTNTVQLTQFIVEAIN